MMKRLHGQEGVTLVEIIAVLVILGITGSVFSRVWGENAGSFDVHDRRADLLYEINQVFERVSFDGREAARIDIPTPTSILFLDHAGAEISRYRITVDGKFQVSRDGGAIYSELARGVVVDRTSLTQDNPRNLIFQLTLEQPTLVNPVHVSATTEIFARN